MKKTLIRLLLYIFVFYLLINIFLYINQKNILYLPDNKDFFDCSSFSDEEKKYYQNNKK